jgi:hypothetical protein
MKRIFSILILNLLFFQLSQAQPARESYRSITWEKFLNSGPDLEQIGFMAVRHSRDIKSSSWSVGCETLDRDFARFSLYKDYVGELGVKHARLQSGWAKCELKKGIYNFEWLDSCVYGLVEQGVRPWICLCYGNPLYGSAIHLGAGLTPLVNSREATEAWLKYISTTVDRYKDVVKEWEIWNEPNGNNNGAVYAGLLIKSAETIKAVQPEAQIFGFSLAGISLEFTKEVFEVLKAKDKIKLVDFLTYHPYDNNPDESYPGVEKLKELARSYNPGIKLYQGENGCPSILEWGHALNNYSWTEFSQAKWFLRRLAGDKLRNIPSSVFTMIDLRYPNMLQSFGLLRANLLYQVIYRRPSYYAVQHMVSFFDDTVITEGEPEYESDGGRPLCVAGFVRDDSKVLLIWFNDKIPGDELKWENIDVRIRGIKFKDPVYVEMITGKVFEIRDVSSGNETCSVTFKKLPLWDSPIMITERKLVTIK